MVWPGAGTWCEAGWIVVWPAERAGAMYDDCVHHDEVEQAIREHTMKEGVSPKSFYPFNSDTERIYDEWKARQGE